MRDTLLDDSRLPAAACPRQRSQALARRWAAALSCAMMGLGLCFANPDSASAQLADYTSANVYACDNGQTFSVIYVGRGEDEFVLIKRPDADTQKLQIAPSGSGTRYQQGSTEWLAKADTGVLLDGDSIIVCADVDSGRTAVKSPANDASSTRWEATVTDTIVTVADCSDCEEDVSIRMVCETPGQPADMLLYVLAGEMSGPHLPQEIQFLIDDVAFTRPARTVDFGLVGPTPVVSIAPDDPVIPALENGRSVLLSSDFFTAEVGLAGSKRALRTFAKHCKWPDPSTRPKPATGPDLQHSRQTVYRQNDANPDVDGAHWFTGDGFGRGTARRISFAIPQSDGMLLSASCAGSKPFQTVVDLFTLASDQPDGSAVSVTVRHDTGSFEWSGKVLRSTDEFTIARFEFPNDPGLWAAIAASDEILISPEGFNPISLPGASGAEALQEFGGACPTEK